MAITWSTVADLAEETVPSITYADFAFYTIWGTTQHTNVDLYQGKRSRLWIGLAAYATRFPGEVLYATPFAYKGFPEVYYGGWRIRTTYASSTYDDVFTYPIDQYITSDMDDNLPAPLSPPSASEDIAESEDGEILQYVSAFVDGAYTPGNAVRTYCVFPKNFHAPDFFNSTASFYLEYIATDSRYASAASIVASIMMKKGADESFIDTDSFDASLTSSLRHTVTSGQTVAEEIKEIVRNDDNFPLLYFNINGQFSYMTQKAPNTCELLRTNIVGNISHEISNEHIVNDVLMSRYSPYLIKITRRSAAPTVINDNEDAEIYWYQDVVPSDTNKDGKYMYTAVEDFDFSSVPEKGITAGISGTNKWTHSSTRDSSNDASIEKYGLVGLRHKNADYNAVDSFTGEIQNDIVRCRFLDDVDDALDRVVYENRPKQRVTLTQNMMGMDFDIGYTTEFDAGTGTIDDLRCIERTTDFNNLTVESTWLESFIPTT